jgi:hypothetical protein
MSLAICSGGLFSNDAIERAFDGRRQLEHPELAAEFLE